jgi:hypothetical protein
MHFSSGRISTAKEIKSIREPIFIPYCKHLLRTKQKSIIELRNILSKKIHESLLQKY